MFLSIIIPAKNEEKNIPLLLKSIRRQSFDDYEIIVADAGSVDQTRDIALSFGARVVRGGMPGVGRNHGAAAAKGDVLLFLDADMILCRENFLKKALEEIKSKNLSVAVPWYHLYSARIMDTIVSSLWNVWIGIAAYVSPSATGTCIFLKRDVHIKNGGFNEKIILGEDTDYICRASKIGRFGIIKSARVEHSPRRFHKEGYIKVIFQAVNVGFYRYVLHCNDYNNQFKYNFNIYDKENEK